MYKVFNLFLNCFIFKTNYRTPLFITNFTEIKYFSAEIPYPNAFFVNNKTDAVLFEYYYNNEKIGHIRYYFITGQIGSFFINEEFQNRGLGKQILSKVIKELEHKNCKEAWAVTSNNHPFWSNVYNKSFTYRDPAHTTVTGNGYFMKLNQKLFIE